jgi:protein phosphatase
MNIIPGNAQDIGARESQQDAFGFSSLQDESFREHGGLMMVLCDGMGGLANGAAASHAAVEALLAGYQRKTASESIPDALNRVIHEAHRAVCSVSGEGGTAGTTVVAAVVWREQLFWASLGDSRLYLCRGNAPAEQLTVDHNLAVMVKERAQRGGGTRRDGTTVRDLEALTAYLGAPTPPPATAGHDGRALEPGDRIVACSDGLYRALTPEAITEIARSADPMTAAEQMVQAVLRQQLPHQDNVTVALLEVAGSSLPAPGPALLRRALPVAASFGAGVVVTCIVFLLFMPRIAERGSPTVPLPPAAVTQSMPARTSDTSAPDTAVTSPAPGPEVPAAGAPHADNGATQHQASTPEKQKQGSTESTAGPAGTTSKPAQTLPQPPQPPTQPGPPQIQGKGGR